MRCTFHAVDRYRLLHHVSVMSDVLRAWDAGRPLTKDLVCALTARSTNHGDGEYRLTPCGGGILVASGESIVTVLRLQPSQREVFAERVTETPEPAVPELSPFGERLRAHGLTVTMDGEWACVGDLRARHIGERIHVRRGRWNLTMGPDDAFRYVVDSFRQI